jgi:hypothetical protein
MDGGLGILDRADIVHAVAIHAVGDLGIAGGQALAVDAGAVESELIYALLGRVAVHELGVSMAARTQGRNGAAVGFAHEPLLPAHGLLGVERGRIASVARHARETMLAVHIAGEQLGRTLQVIFESGVAIEASVWRRRGLGR